MADLVNSSNHPVPFDGAVEVVDGVLDIEASSRLSVVGGAVSALGSVRSKFESPGVALTTAAVGGAVAGVASVAFVRVAGRQLASAVERRPAKRSKRKRMKDVVASKSFLVDVHLLK